MPKTYDVAIVGAGFAGMYMLYRLRALGLDVRVIERGDGVGGTWYWNRYPGARCDVESMEYSYGFSEALQQEWEWTERFAAQPEILAYANHVADRFDLRSDIDFETEVVGATFSEDDTVWTLDLCGSDGVPGTLRAHFCVMATGCLSSANVPDFPGRETFEGEVFHTGHWPHEPVRFEGKRVGVIGTGSSAIQAIPLIAEAAKSLTVFQRTANYSIPARNGPLDSDYVRALKKDYAQFRAENREMSPGLGARFPKGVGGSALDASEALRREQFDFRWQRGGFGFLGGFDDFFVSKPSNDLAAEYVRERIRETVTDPRVAELLCPDQVIGCKRICLDTHYFETYNRDNVTLVDVKADPIEAITPRGLRTQSGEFGLDTLVFATGFDAMTGTLTRMNIRGPSGQSLGEKWEAGPRTYLGLCSAGFPNLFMISGPGSPSVLTNMIVSIEQHVEWVAACLAYLREEGLTRIEASVDAEDAWVEHVNAIAAPTLYPTCNSWYLGANIPGKPRVFMPHIGFPPYARKCADVAAGGYEGFALA